MNTISEALEKAIPKMETFPKAKQMAIGEALTLCKEAKTLELEAMRALLDALKLDYQFWTVEGRTKTSHRERRVFCGASGPDVEARARRAGFLTVLRISPLDSTDGI